MRAAWLALLLAACGGAQGGPRERRAADEVAPDAARDPLAGEVDDEVRLQLAETLIDGGAHAEAMRMLRELQATRPKDARVHYLLGAVLRDRGVYDQAERSLSLAVELQPDLAMAHGALGVLADLKGDHARALASHTKAIELAPLEARFRNNLGFSRALAGDHAAAIAAYGEALRLDPTARVVYVNLGFALAAAGRDDEAKRMFRQAGTEAETLNNLALAHELRGDPGRARRLYREALQKDPNLGVAAENLRGLEQGEAKAEPR